MSSYVFGSSCAAGVSRWIPNDYANLAMFALCFANRSEEVIDSPTVSSDIGTYCTYYESLGFLNLTGVKSGSLFGGALAVLADDIGF